MLNGTVELELVPIADIEPAPGADSAPEGGIWSGRELEHCRGLKTAKRRRDWLAGRLAAKRLLRRRLSRCGLSIPMNRLEVRSRGSGEPYFHLPAGCAGAGSNPVSISHSGRYALAAMGGPGTRVGADVETVEEREESWLELLAHESERSASLRADPVRQTVLWTLKEAVLKLLGLGLSADLWDVRFVPREDGTAAATLGPVRLELRGKAEAAWGALGRPEIDFESALLEDGSALSVARSEARELVGSRA